MRVPTQDVYAALRTLKEIVGTAAEKWELSYSAVDGGYRVQAQGPESLPVCPLGKARRTAEEMHGVLHAAANAARWASVSKEAAAEAREKADFDALQKS